jgi:hypothetical protein
VAREIGLFEMMPHRIIVGQQGGEGKFKRRQAQYRCGYIETELFDNLCQSPAD